MIISQIMFQNHPYTDYLAGDKRGREVYKLGDKGERVKNCHFGSDVIFECLSDGRTT